MFPYNITKRQNITPFWYKRIKLETSFSHICNTRIYNPNNHPSCQTGDDRYVVWKRPLGSVSKQAGSVFSNTIKERVHIDLLVSVRYSRYIWKSMKTTTDKTYPNFY